jgi:peptide/nickel transport system substrate-binding protein
MQGGAIDTLFIPRPSDWEVLQNTPQLTIQDVSTAETFVLRMRVDQEPWQDVRVRQALKLCQDRAKILEISYSDRATAFDAHVARSSAHCASPQHDPNGPGACWRKRAIPTAKVKLTTKNDLGGQKCPLLKKLAAEGGLELI